MRYVQYKKTYNKRFTYLHTLDLCTLPNVHECLNTTSYLNRIRNAFLQIDLRYSNKSQVKIG